MSDKAAGQKTRSPEGCDENGLAAALLLSHVSIQICSFVAPCRRPVLIATPLYQSRTWCTSAREQDLPVLPQLCGHAVVDQSASAEVRTKDSPRFSRATHPSSP